MSKALDCTFIIIFDLKGLSILVVFLQRESHLKLYISFYQFQWLSLPLITRSTCALQCNEICDCVLEDRGLSLRSPCIAAELINGGECDDLTAMGLQWRL